jgi:transcriptional regulator with XRE-family HTH domain
MERLLETYCARREIDKEKTLPICFPFLCPMAKKSNPVSLPRPRGRASLQKTRLAKLRKLIGVDAVAFAGLAGVSLNYLQRLESGHRPLGEELALKIQKQTAIAAQWLLGGGANPVDDMGDPYTRKSYERRRIALAERPGALLQRAHLRGMLGAKVEAIVAAAGRAHDERIFCYRLEKFLAENAAEFGIDEEVVRLGEKEAMLLKSLRDVFDERITGYRKCRKQFASMLTTLEKKAQKPLAPGMPASGPGILPILQIVAVQVGIREPWRINDNHDDDD